MKQINKFISPILLTSLLSAGAIVGVSSVHAAGGGGGGGGSTSPSASTPRYDAAEEYQKGLTAYQAEDYKKAVTAFRRSISAAPRATAAHYFLGASYMGLDNFKKARKSFEKTIKLDPNMIEAHRDLAIAYHKLDMSKKAQATLADLRSLNDRCAGTCVDNAKLTSAISAVESMIAGNQASVQSDTEFSNINAEASDKIYIAAVALINEKKYEAAIVQLETAQKNLGPHPDVLTYLGFANRKLQNFDVAETYYKQALAVAPDHLGANEYFGELMIERGDLKGAKAQLAKLDALCSFGCYEAEELRRWIHAAS